MSLSNLTRPGAMSLLDKYAQINQNIEEARRRVAAARSALETTNQSIENLREDRSSTEAETAVANQERFAFEEEMKRVKLELNEKRQEKQRVEGEYRLAKREYSDTKRQIDLERLAFLEQCREFRSSCKRMRVAATILVLEGGFDEKGEEGDVWRRLKQDVDCDEEGENVKGRKKVDVELERMIKDEKECREAFIEAECALHAARSEHKEAVQRCDGRNQKLAQQRAQLERHRKEVLELEREVGQVKDEIVKANQDAKGYENAWKRGQSNPNNTYNRNTYNNGSYSSHFHPPPERSNQTPLHNSNSSNNCGINSRGNVSNPYKSRPSNPYQNRSNQGNTGRSSGQYASEMLRNESSYGRGSQNQGNGSSQPHSYGSSQSQSYGSSQYQSFNSSQTQSYVASQTQNRTWSNARNQRQFGTAVDISVDYSASTSPKFNSTKTNRISLNTTASAADDSSTSSSSSDDDIIEFDIFGKGK